MFCLHSALVLVHHLAEAVLLLVETRALDDEALLAVGQRVRAR